MLEACRVDLVAVVDYSLHGELRAHRVGRGRTPTHFGGRMNDGGELETPRCMVAA